MGALVIVTAALWSGFWFYLRGQAQARMDAAVAELKSAGYEVTWRERRIGGYPFRLNVDLTEARLREPSGWALTAPRLEAQAYAYALGSWILAAPEGLTFVRPLGGPVQVKGELIRASLTHLDRSPPNFSFEGVKLAFAPETGAQPFALTFADRVEFHLRAGPRDETAAFFRVDRGKARLSGLFGRIAEDKPISIVWDSILSKTSAFRGRDWPRAVRAWADAGGQASVRQAGITAGEAVIGAQAGSLTVGYDGRLSGTLDASLRQAPRALGAMAETGVISPDAALAASAVAAARQQGEVARATLTFQAGRTTLGPVAVGPAPRVY